MSETHPLVVDLDGTLTKVDTLWESVLLLIKKKPYIIFILPLWLLRGKVVFKHKIINQVLVDVSVLPYNVEVIDIIKQNRGKRKIILASASCRKIVEAVAAHLQIFDHVIATETSNLSGESKLTAIRALIGEGCFDYMGNSCADVPLWNQAKKAYVVGSRKLKNRIKPEIETIIVKQEKLSLLYHMIKAMRPHQWLKNILLFLPIFLAHEIFDFHKLKLLAIAFASFSFCASAVYITNDLFDIESDRYHSTKKNRPFASGNISVVKGAVMVLLLFMLSFTISYFLLSVQYTQLLAGYALLTFVYSFYIKDHLVVDVLTLSGLYTLRIFAGAVAVDVPISTWMLAFSLFFFLSLAFLKRYIELNGISDEKKIKGRNYEYNDKSVVLSAGLSCGYLSVLVFSLYISNSVEVNTLYKHPQWLWLLVLPLIYWITRIWFLAQRGLVDGDPVVFAMKDVRSLVTGFVCAGIIMAASFY